MLQDQIKKSNEEDVSTHIEIAKSYERIIHVLVLLSKIHNNSIGTVEFYSHEIRLLVYFL